MIDLIELQHALSVMNERTKLYAVIKLEMESRGHWKAKARGKGFRKGRDDRRGSLV